MTMSTKPANEARADNAVNTDRELWREKPGDYYSDSIHVTHDNGIGINCGGHVIVKPMREWHRLAAPPHPAAPADAAKVVTAMEKEFGNLINEAYACDSVRSGDRIREKIGAWAFDHQAEVAEALAAARRLLDAPPGVGERMLPPVEQVAAKVHEAWMHTKKVAGIATRRSESGEELMVPYDHLSDAAKELDRATVRAVYDAMEALAAPASSAAAGSVATGEGGK
jgi:hypothetical protein